MVFGRTCRVQKGKELNYFQRNLLDVEILSNLRFDSLEVRGTLVTRVTNNFYKKTSDVPRGQSRGQTDTVTVVDM